MIYLISTLICGIFNLLCLVNIQAWQLALESWLMQAVAKSAEMPYAEIAHSREERSNIMLRQWDENLKKCIFHIFVNKNMKTRHSLEP